MDRASLDRRFEASVEQQRIIDRISGDDVALLPHDFDDLCWVHLFDWLEQVPRSREWDYRRAAYSRMADRLGPVAVEHYDRTFAQEGSGAKGARPQQSA